MELPFIPPTPPFQGIERKLESSVRKACLSFDLLPESGNLAIALSGGKDSLALLFILKALLGRGFSDLPLVAIHIGGAFSCGASIPTPFLASLCKELGVTFITKESPYNPEESPSCYSCSRYRRSLLFQITKEHDCTHIAFGHHMDDHAETVLLNLFHKGSFEGILPKVDMIKYGITIIRPLIFVKEKDIIAFAKKANFLRMSCQCPYGTQSMRREIKHLLEDAEELFPHARSNLASAAHLFGTQKAQIIATTSGRQ